MSQPKVSVKYEDPQLRMDFPDLDQRSTPTIATVPLIGVLWKRFKTYLIQNMRACDITHIRNMSDPHFSDETYEIVLQGRIVDVEVGHDSIDEKDYCTMARYIKFISEPCDAPLIEGLMLRLRAFACEQGLETLKKDALEHIKHALREDQNLRLEQIYACIRTFYGSYELEKFESELCRDRRAETHT